GHDCSEQKCHPHQAARYPARLLCRRIERKAKNHHHQQREEQHGVYGILRSPLQANVFFEGGASNRQKSHCAAACSVEYLPTIFPASMATNSFAQLSSSAGWCVTTKIVLPSSRNCASNPAISFAERASTFEKGSSSKSSCGSFNSARASDIRCRMPCEYCPMGRSRPGSSFTAAITSRHL